MYGYLKVLENGHNVDLLFDGKRSARYFERFIMLYVMESGAHNGYGVYWLLSGAPVAGIDVKMGRPSLNHSYIHKMAVAICDTRMLRNPMFPPNKDAFSIPEYSPLIDEVRGAIHFHFDEHKLPPRQRPTVGELVRIPNLSRPLSDIARVAEILGDQVTLAPCAGGIREPMTVPISEVMKIFDFWPEGQRTGTNG